MDTRHPVIARAQDSVLVVIDCQERLWRVISDKDPIEKQILTLLRGAALLDVPVLVTEQNPLGLGRTIAPLKAAAKDAPVIAKASFSCFGEERFVQALRAVDRGTVVLCGIEAHICVLQTALDALAAGYRVHVAADACGTRRPHNLRLGLDRAARAAAELTAVESVLFEWMERCDGPAFRKVVDLLR